MSKKCDICKMEQSEIIYDGKTVYGPWAWMCKDCFSIVGVGLGTGKGQKFKFEDNSLKKLEG